MKKLVEDLVVMYRQLNPAERTQVVKKLLKLTKQETKRLEAELFAKQKDKEKMEIELLEKMLGEEQK